MNFKRIDKEGYLDARGTIMDRVPILRLLHSLHHEEILPLRVSTILADLFFVYFFSMFIRTLPLEFSSTERMNWV